MSHVGPPEHLMCVATGTLQPVPVNADGSGIRQPSFNMFNDFTPSMLHDGRILFGRWEYNERSVTTLHKPFTIHPNGTMVAPYYGNATIRPNVVMFARPVPGSRKVMALLTAHHGQTHGAVGLIDVRRGLDGDAPLAVLTPNVPVTGEAADGLSGWFQRSDAACGGHVALLLHANGCAVAGVDLGDLRGRPAWQFGAGLRDPGLILRRAGAARASPSATGHASGPRSCDAEDAEATLVVADVPPACPKCRGARPNTCECWGRASQRCPQGARSAPRAPHLHGQAGPGHGTRQTTVRPVSSSRRTGTCTSKCSTPASGKSSGCRRGMLEAG